ncbi:phosphotransferase family protein [Nocardioides deserti]|uniref:Phosphotransferase family protein n=1 Tax=Nocardioides deserti TaxID=1588644 RepID=A0ABR6U5P7_9ACTN|nr:phosphotransferase family protein [Nocardioides deserti]MBC2959635.1 phosphotransferase family protein [Nocardioides deserti]GGO74117.1 phosphotransferase [Nocardioides deserti]
MSSTDSGNPAKPVREEDAFDAAAVSAWLDGQGAGVGPIDEVRQFSGGASNLTYLLVAGDRELILRRPPAGKKAAGAHDMGREFRIQSALAPVFPYVAGMVGHCTDEAVIGSEFYVMEKVPGLILRSEFPREVSAEEADALCERALDVLVALHSVDVPAVPELAALGRGEGYVGRQVRGWVGRMADARTDDTGDWSDVVAWIEEHQPADVAQVLIHNDFRFDNLVLDDDDQQLAVRAVLDWEMATVGDPLMDLSSTLAYWVEAADDELFQLFRRQPTNAPGMWTRDQLVERYCARMGYEITADQRLFYEVFGLFRLAVIAQQIWYRYVHKQTTNESHAVLGQVVAYLEARCRRLIAEHGSGTPGSPA